MSFCQYCGRKLEEGEVCNCNAAPASINTEDMQINHGNAEQADFNQAQVPPRFDLGQAQVPPQFDLSQTQVPPQFDLNQAQVNPQFDVNLNQVPPQEGPYAPVNQAPAKDKKKLFTIIGVAAGAVVLIAAVVLILMSVMKSPFEKVAEATVKTLHSSKLTDALLNDALLTDKATVTVEGKYSDYGFLVKTVVDGTEKNVYLSADMDGSELEAQIGIDSKSLKLSLPSFDLPETYTYEYKNKNKGALDTVIDEEYFEIIDYVCEQLASGGETYADYKDVILDWVNDLKVEKADKKSLKVAGEKHDCSGYIFTIVPDDVMKLAEALEKQYEKTLSEVPDEIADLLDDEIDWDDIYDEIEDFDDVEVKIKVYLYKGMLAAVNIDNGEGYEVKILFQGTDYRLQNVTVQFNDEDIIEVKGKLNDDTEKATIMVERDELSYSYNPKDGKLKIEVDGMEISGSLISDRKGITFEIKKIAERNSSMDLKATISIKKGAENIKFSGKKIVLNDLDEDELEELGEDVAKQAMKLLNLGSLYSMFGTRSLYDDYYGW